MSDIYNLMIFYLNFITKFIFYKCRLDITFYVNSNENKGLNYILFFYLEKLRDSKQNTSVYFYTKIYNMKEIYIKVSI